MSMTLIHALPETGMPCRKQAFPAGNRRAQPETGVLSRKQAFPDFLWKS